ncbi:MAG: PQQ-binding-like beta-propeller repeat protein, partial [Clostridia bacterium]|nr:PQQ-binding-like beta-propeller repeat protein [Clostridia bacterium]
FEESYSGYVEAYPGNESGWNEARGSRLTIDIGGEDAAGDQGEEADPVSPLAFALVDAAPLASLDVNETIRRGNETVTEFARETSILVGDADMYRFYTTQAGELQEGMKGVHTFRGDNTRGNASSGVVPSVPTKLETEWSANAGGPIDSETAFGAQPLLVRWHQQFRAKMEPVLPEKREQKSLTEVVFAANDGNIYFFDAEDGTKTREPMQVDEPMLGTPALYPRGIPIMFIGSGVYGGDNSASMRSFNLLTGKNSGNLIGDNEFATSKDHTFITSPLVLNDADTMLAAGGNGIFYALTLNSEVNPADFSYAIQATAVLLATDSDGADDAALSTLAAYGEHAYVATVGGVLKSIDMNTMTVDWAKDLGGATYAALAINVRGEGDPLLYAVSVTETGASIIRCINAKTGDPVWEVKGGSAVKASPLVGEGSLKGTVYFTAPDRIMALDGLTGALQWETPLEGAVATSPIAVYDGEETGVVIQGDAAGLHVIDGGTGEIRYSLPLDGAVVGSPAAFDDLIVVITESGMLHGVRAK